MKASIPFCALSDHFVGASKMVQTGFSSIDFERFAITAPSYLSHE
jgi:hypothetical protein